MQVYINTSNKYTKAQEDIIDFNFNSTEMDNKFVRLFVDSPKYPVLYDKEAKINVTAASFWRETKYYSQIEYSSYSEGEEYKYEWTTTYSKYLQKLDVPYVKSVFLNGDVDFNGIIIDKSSFQMSNCIFDYDISNITFPKGSVLSSFKIYDKNILYSSYRSLGLKMRPGINRYSSFRPYPYQEEVGDRKVIFHYFAPKTFTVVGFFKDNTIQRYDIDGYDVSNVVEGNQSTKFTLKPKLNEIINDVYMRAFTFFVLYFAFFIYIAPKEISLTVTAFIALFNVTFRAFQLKTYPIKPQVAAVLWIPFFSIVYQKRNILIDALY